MTTAPTPSIFEPARLGPLTLRNRIVKAATFEGVMPRGAVSDDLINFHAEVARGGQDAALADPALAHGVNCVAGQVTNEAVAASLGRPFVDVATALASAR